MGATQVGCTVVSKSRAAGILPMSTVTDVFRMIPGPAGTQAGSVQILVMSVMRAAGNLPTSTVGHPLTIGSGNGGCGNGNGGGWIGA